MSAGVDRVSTRRRRADVVGGGGGGATPTDLRCLPAPTTAYPMSIRARLRSDGSDRWYEMHGRLSPWRVDSPKVPA
jgi:hypothetical protein